MNDWMKGISGNSPLSEINIPGTHDSAANFVSFSVISKCQNQSIRKQLQMGTRFLDIRLELEENRFYAVHGIADCRPEKKKSSGRLYFESIFNTCLKFLNENKTETIIISLKQDDGENSQSFFDMFFKQFILRYENCWFLKNRIPCLDECRGKLVLLRRCSLNENGAKYSDNSGLNFSDWKDQGDKKIDSPNKTFITNENEPPVEAVIQDRYMHSPKKKWKNVFLPALESALPNEKTIYLHFLSTAALRPPKLNAKYLNPLFSAYELQKKPYGWIILDFPTEQMCKKIIESNN